MALLAWVDRFLHDPGPPPPGVAEPFDHHFSADEQAELGLAVGMFLGFSKMLIVLGLEPEQMETTVLPTPGSRRPPRTGG